MSLSGLQRFEEVKSLLRKSIPVARRVLGEEHLLTLTIQSVYALALHRDTSASLDDLGEAVETLENIDLIARRLLGGAHPMTVSIEQELRNARAALRVHRLALRIVLSAGSLFFAVAVAVVAWLWRS